MKKYILLLLPLLISCEKYITEVSDLTMSGKYVVSKLQVVQTSYPTSKDSVYLNNQLFVNSNLPDPFDSIRINDFYIHFTYSNVMINWLGNDRFTGREIWKYGQRSNDQIFYNRVPWTFDGYSLGSIQFHYLPSNRNSVTPVTLHVDSDRFESLQLSGLEFTPQGPNGTRYRLVFSLTRVGP